MKTRSSNKRKETEELSDDIEESKINTKKLKTNKKTAPAPKKKQEKTKDSKVTAVVEDNDNKEKEEEKDDDDEGEEVTLQTLGPITRQTVKWNEVDIEELDRLLYPDIREIAKSIGISAVGIRKQLLIEKIKFIINMNSDAEKSQIKKDNCNPFNKSTFNQLVITPDKQGQDELLFWKIFKNKSIFKHIMSFMNVLPNPVGYDYVISVKDMLTNNQISLLKEKVKRNQYLSFKDRSSSNYNPGYGNYYRSVNKPISIEIYSTIKDDESFYQSLFKWYRVQITKGTSDLQVIADQLIVANCLVGYNVLISNHQYKPTVQDFQTAVKHNSTEFITLIKTVLNDGGHDNIAGIQVYLEYNKSLKLEENIESFKQFVNTFKPTKNVLKEITIKWFETIENPMAIKLSNLVNLINLLKDDSQWEIYRQSKFSLPDFCDHNDKFTNIPFETIKETVCTFNFTDQQLESNVNDQINYSSSERDNIRLLLYVFYKILYGSERWYQFKHSGEYFVCYSDEFIVSEIKETKLKRIKSEQHYPDIQPSALEHGNYSKLLNWVEFKTLFSLFSQPMSIHHYSSHSSNPVDTIIRNFDHQSNYYLEHNTNSLQEPKKLLFMYCKDKESQEKFIADAIKNIKDPNSKFKLKPMFLFLMLVYHDDLELVKLFVNQMGKDQIRITTPDNGDRSCLSNSITKYIKSIEMMDYINYEFRSLLIQNNIHGNNNSYNNAHFYNFHQPNNNFNINDDLIVCQITNVNLLNHFEKLVTNENQIVNQQGEPRLIWLNISNITVSLVQHVLSNSSLYTRLDQFLAKKPIDFDGNLENQHIYFSSLKYSIKSTEKLLFDPMIFFNLSTLKYYPPKSFVMFLQWLSECPYVEINFPNSKQAKLVQYFITNQDDYEQLFEDVTYTDIIEDFKEVVKFSIVRGDLQTLSRTLDILLDALDTLILVAPTCYTKFDKVTNSNNQVHIKTFIQAQILQVAIIEEQYYVLEYLYLNYSRILKKKTNSKSPGNNNNDTDSLFTNSELRVLLVNSLSCFNVKITELLLSFCTLSKDQFKKTNCSQDSYNYFKNKFLKNK